MASYTSHYNLKKPAGNEKVQISDINGNMDTLDTQLYSTNQAISNIRQNEIVIPITANTDLNTLTTPGYYNLYGASNLVNAPASGANRLGLLVQRAESNQYVYQIATDNVQDATGVYVRSCKGGTWSAWQQLALKSNVATGTMVIACNAGKTQVSYANLPSGKPDSQSKFLQSLYQCVNHGSVAEMTTCCIDGVDLIIQTATAQNVTIRWFYFGTI